MRTDTVDFLIFTILPVVAFGVAQWFSVEGPYDLLANQPVYHHGNPQVRRSNRRTENKQFPFNCHLLYVMLQCENLMHRTGSC